MLCCQARPLASVAMSHRTRGYILYIRKYVVLVATPPVTLWNGRRPDVERMNGLDYASITQP